MAALFGDALQDFVFSAFAQPFTDNAGIENVGGRSAKLTKIDDGALASAEIAEPIGDDAGETAKPLALFHTRQGDDLTSRDAVNDSDLRFGNRLRHECWDDGADLVMDNRLDDPANNLSHFGGKALDRDSIGRCVGDSPFKLHPTVDDPGAKFDGVAGNEDEAFTFGEAENAKRLPVLALVTALNFEGCNFQFRQHLVGVAQHVIVALAGQSGDFQRAHRERRCVDEAVHA